MVVERVERVGPFAIAAGLGLKAVAAFQLVGAQSLTYPEAMGVVVTQGSSPGWCCAATGRAREVHWLLWLSAALFVVYFAIEPLRGVLGL